MTSLTPTLAWKQSLCFSCWDISSNLKRCSACTRVAYCSINCQRQDWKRNHKKICKELVALNKQKRHVPSDGRRWNQYYEEQELEFITSGTSNPCELGRFVGYEPYCYHCYRRESQLEDGAKLKVCTDCLLTSFCTSCPKTHPSAECATLQDLVVDEKIMLALLRQTGETKSVSFTQSPRLKYLPLSFAADWFDYHTRLSDKGSFSSKMSRDLKYQGNNPKDREFVERLRYSTNTTTVQLTLIAALEAMIPNIIPRTSINLHILGPRGNEFASIPAFEELLHHLPYLITLKLTFIGPDVPEDFHEDTKNSKIRTLKCCATCTAMGWSVSMTFWKGLYHEYVNTEFYKTPDLAAAFQSGFSVDDQEHWLPTIVHLAHAPHPTLFTAARYFEIQGEIEAWHALGAEFAQSAEVNKWKGMTPSIIVCGDKPNEISYVNHWWYIVKHR